MTAVLHFSRILAECSDLDQQILVEELHQHMYAKNLKDLKLEEHNKIGYTLKALGAGFWALQQSDFRKALTELVMDVRQLNCS